MKKKLFYIILLLIVAGVSISFFTKKEDTHTELVVFAASSLTEAMTEVAQAYEAESGIKLVCTFESSGTLEKQLESGAACDIFLSASQKQSEALSPLFAEPPIAFLENKVVLAVSNENSKGITDFSDVTKDNVQLIALGSSDAPIGQYAQEIFENLGPNGALGGFFYNHWGVRLTMTWWSAIFATILVSFPLMYRIARGAFAAFDETIAQASQTLGLSNTYIFWRIRIPCCKEGLLAGGVLAFARALGEYGATGMVAGYIPGKTATISTTVYQLWRTGNDALAFRWVMVNIAISFLVMVSVGLLEKKQYNSKKGSAL